MMFCASAGSSPELNRLDLDALFAHRLLDAAATRNGETGFRNFARIEDDVAILQTELLDHAIGQVHSRRRIHSCRHRLGGNCPWRLEIVIVETDDDDAGLDGGADAGVESIRAGNRNGDAVDAAGRGASIRSFWRTGSLLAYCTSRSTPNCAAASCAPLTTGLKNCTLGSR